MELPKKNFVWGFDVRKWSIGFVVHTEVKALGTVIEINVLPIKFYWRIKQPKRKMRSKKVKK